jgi:hypothetical protein
MFFIVKTHYALICVTEEYGHHPNKIISAIEEGKRPGFNKAFPDEPVELIQQAWDKVIHYITLHYVSNRFMSTLLNGTYARLNWYIESDMNVYRSSLKVFVVCTDFRINSTEFSHILHHI